MNRDNVFIGGAVVLFVGVAYYFHKKDKSTTQISRSALSGNLKGYSDMMKLSPTYYNNTSINGLSGSQNPFPDPTIVTPWTLGFNGGDGSEISAGWTNDPDTYSATVSNDWLQEAVSGSHL